MAEVTSSQSKSEEHRDQSRDQGKTSGEGGVMSCDFSGLELSDEQKSICSDSAREKGMSACGCGIW